MKSMHKQLREIGELLGLDCGDNSCLAAERKGGMRTNGGCRCDFVNAVCDLKAQLESKNAALESADAALNEDVIVRTMLYPDGRHETWLAAEEAEEMERMQEAIDLYRSTLARVEALCKEADAKDLWLETWQVRAALRGEP